VRSIARTNSPAGDQQIPNSATSRLAPSAGNVAVSAVRQTVMVSAAAQYTHPLTSELVKLMTNRSSLITPPPSGDGSFAFARRAVRLHAGVSAPSSARLA
jgi:hypothetical protein